MTNPAKCAWACGLLLCLSLPVRGLDSLEVARAGYLEARGNSLHDKGRTLIYTGAALLPLGLLALVPVMHDGAFGITAADPGIGGFILGAGFALMELGIPVMGAGADRLDAAATTRDPGYAAGDSGWWRYGQGWRWIGYGGILLATALPFAVVGGLDYENEMPWVDYTALALGSGGLALGAAGVVRHGHSLIHFGGRANRARRALKPGAEVSWQPVLMWEGRGATTAGVRLSAGF